MKRIAATLLAVLALGSIACAASTPDAGLDRPIRFATERPLTLRMTAGAIWTSADAATEVNRAWKMPARGPIAEVSVSTRPREGYVVTFSQGGVEWRGELDADRKPIGALEVVTTPRPLGARTVDLASR